jgi:regulator of sigma E protease
MIQTIVAFVVVLAVLIFVHELGHFLVARLCGVRVLTFAIGFGPTLLSRRGGDTEYALKAFPLGGYVKMFGEETDQTLSPEERAVAFSHKGVWQRAAIVFAGPFFNLLTAVLIFWAVFVWGVPVLTSQVGEIQADSAAAEAGLMTGDTITAIDGQKVTEWEQIRARVQELGGKALAVTVLRDGKAVDLTVTPRRTETQTIFGEATEAWLIGISPQGTTVTVRHGLFEGAWLGVKRTYEITHLTVLGIVKLIERAIPSNTIGGPILIAQMAGEQASLGLMNVLLFVALLSVNLGVLNLLPIPVLDGGHLMFLVAEAVRGRPVSIKVREVAQQAGLFLLLALMAFAFYNDIMRFFTHPTG